MIMVGGDDAAAGAELLKERWGCFRHSSLLFTIKGEEIERGDW